MSNFDYDLIVIGGGSAGLTGAKFAASLGKKVLLVEKNTLGGDCLLYGCVPSKALISMNKVLHSPFLKTLNLSFSSNEKIDFRLIKQDIKNTIAEVGESDSKEKLNSEGVNVILGAAKFINTHTLDIDGKSVTSKFFLIATGSHPFIPNIDGIENIKYYTNETVFDIERLPDSMVVLGGGPIGCELAQAFSNLGSKVTIIQRNQFLIPKDDKSASVYLADKFYKDQIDINFNDEIIKIEKLENDKIKIFLKSGSELITDLLLLSVGRQPNILNLNLENIGINFTNKGINIDEYVRTNVSNIYASGDVTGSFLFTHFAAHQANAAVLNMFLPIFLKQKFDISNIPWVTFVSPEIAHCGMTEEQIIQKQIAYQVIDTPFCKIDRAITEKTREGFIKIFKDSKDYILGAVIVGERAGELIMEFEIARANKIKISELLSVMHPYPTFSSGLQIAMYDDYLKTSKLLKFLKMFI